MEKKDRGLMRIVKTEHKHIYKVKRYLEKHDIDICLYVGSKEGCEEYIYQNTQDA